jgi:flagellar basal-body rod protein FlgF
MMNWKTWVIKVLRREIASLLRGLYTSTSGMNVQQAKIESVANNLANATTPGYKKESIQTQSFPEVLLLRQGGPKQMARNITLNDTAVIGSISMGALVADVSIDHAQGAGVETGKSTDILLQGPGFLAVSVPVDGEPDRVCYTRNGELSVDGEGFLTAGSGNRVLGEGGPIRVRGEDFQIASDGTVYENSLAVGRLRLIEFDDVRGLSKEGDGIYVNAQDAGMNEAANTAVHQGWLEVSNVNVNDEMVALISVLRSYEANQKLVQVYDEQLSKTVNEVGRIR